VTPIAALRRAGVASLHALALGGRWTADRSRPVRDITVGDLLREAAAKDPDGLALMEGVPDADARRWWT